MSLATTIGAGTLLGGLLAVGVYTAMAPSDAVPASAQVAPTYAPVPTPTKTVEAEDCVAPAVLEDDECIVHEPGPTVTLPALPAPAQPAPAGTHDATTAPRSHDDAKEHAGAEAGDDDSQGEDQQSDDHESDHHDDGDHEDEGGGEHDD